MIKISTLFFITSLFIVATSCSFQKDGEWVNLLNGTDLNGWEANENKDAFKVVDGTIFCDGKRSHLFYKGDYKKGVFKNFEFKAMVKTLPNSNSGIVFHTQEQARGPLLVGYEVQINHSYEREGDFQELKKTGSIYGYRNVYFSTHNDEEWFELHFKVIENSVKVFVNGTKVNEYIQPDDPWRRKNDKYQKFNRGLIAIQCHDEFSKTYFKDIKIKVLPDAEKITPPTDKEWDTKITKLHHANFPIVDFHVHLKGGLKIEEVIENSMKLGINYGVAPNCGLHFPITDDKSLYAYMDTVKARPIFRGMQAEGREWISLFSPEAIAEFDYVFTDAMTWTDNDGHRMRLWMEDEVFIKNEEDFMNQLISKIESIISQEPIDIHVNPTFLPAVIADKYDELWTDDRIDRFVKVLADNHVALEINSRYRIPSEKILRKAKEAGVKFSFGTNNVTNELGRLDYCFEMIEKLKLNYKDMFLPKPKGQKPVEIKGLPKEITG